MSSVVLNPENDRRRLMGLVYLAFVSLALYVVVALVSSSFGPGKPTVGRPIPLVLILFTVLFGLYLVAVRWAVQVESVESLRLAIWLPAIAFRLVMFWSSPIQEVDVYRYLWDGAVTNARVSAFKYTPKEIRDAPVDLQEPKDLRLLVSLREEQPGLKAALERVHFGFLPTVYPPVSQWVFAVVDAITPNNASLATRINFMRAVLVLIDLATLWVVTLLLFQAGLPYGLCVLYAWCPLLVKEVANSAHLDSIAVFLTTLAIFFLCQRSDSWGDQQASRASTASLVISAVMLALAIGAKLYPVVLAPLFFVLWVKQMRLAAVLPVITLVMATALVLYPMFSAERTGSSDSRAADSTVVAANPRVANEAASLSSVIEDRFGNLKVGDGLNAFLRRWEMNDFLFLITVENLKDTSQMKPHDVAWFSCVPSEWRISFRGWLQDEWNVPVDQTPFLGARLLTTALFGLIVLWLCIRAVWTDHVGWWMQTAMMTLAWFWLLSPTQNPWYWLWVLPLLPFARSRVWWLMSGIVMVYYLRFWFGYEFNGQPVAGTPYQGNVFFDLVVTWLEFAPWFLLLFLDGLRLNFQESKARAAVR